MLADEVHESPSSLCWLEVKEDRRTRNSCEPYCSVLLALLLHLLFCPSDPLLSIVATVNTDSIVASVFREASSLLVGVPGKGMTSWSAELGRG